jgi:hypothetical protein
LVSCHECHYEGAGCKAALFASCHDNDFEVGVAFAQHPSRMTAHRLTLVSVHAKPPRPRSISKAFPKTDRLAFFVSWRDSPFAFGMALAQHPSRITAHRLTPVSVHAKPPRPRSISKHFQKTNRLAFSAFWRDNPFAFGMALAQHPSRITAHRLTPVSVHAKPPRPRSISKAFPKRILGVLCGVA